MTGAVRTSASALLWGQRCEPAPRPRSGLAGCLDVPPMWQDSQPPITTTSAVPMKASAMPEPSSSSAAGLVGWKLIGSAAGAASIGAGLAAIVVMCMTPPRSIREWAVGLISTVVGSITGGAAVIQYLGLQAWMHEPAGLVAVLGLVFASGLPAWAVVRWAFTWIARREGKDLGEVAAELRRDISGG